MKIRFSLFLPLLLVLLFSACQQENIQEIQSEVLPESIQGPALKEKGGNPDNNPCDVDEDNLRILFIGNSFTNNYSTDLPQLFQELAFFNYQDISQISESAENGFTLADHFTYGLTVNLVNQGNWDYVILQENSGYLANGGSGGFANSVNNFVNLIGNNSSNAKILLFQVVPPVAHTNANYNALQNSWNTLFANVASNHSNVYVCNVGQAFTNAYNGAAGYNVVSPDELRLGASGGYHFWNSGGFLAAVTFYAAIFRNKPCIPNGMTFVNNTGNQISIPVATAVPQYHSLAQIGYLEGQYAVHSITVAPTCRFSYGRGDYPCD
jgi:hypothetical protein